MSNSVHVAVGVIVRQDRHVLIAYRSPDKHQGGLWEFPGGKVEPGETVEQALGRELKEELDLEVLGCSPIMQISHDYGDKQVMLDVWLVNRFQGKVRGRENQPTAWQSLADIESVPFPEANMPIVEYLKSL